MGDQKQLALVYGHVRKQTSKLFCAYHCGRKGVWHQRIFAIEQDGKIISDLLASDWICCRIKHSEIKQVKQVAEADATERAKFSEINISQCRYCLFSDSFMKLTLGFTDQKDYQQPDWTVIFRVCKTHQKSFTALSGQVAQERHIRVTNEQRKWC